jgi:acetyltransferase-like isoleucine patch superfamily enzyme
MGMSNYISKWLRDRKIYFRINWIYINKFPGCRIRSILGTSVEKLIKNGVVIEENVTIAEDLKFLGRYVYIGKNAYIASCNGIGNFCSISAGVRIGLMAHPSDFVSTSPVFYAARRGFVSENSFDEAEGKRTTIGHDVLISANAMIRNGVNVGTGAIIGAGAFVNEDVPPYAIVAGVPAKIIRYRFEDAMIQRLLESQWWERSDDEIKKAGSFSNPDAFLKNLGC